MVNVPVSHVVLSGSRSRVIRRHLIACLKHLAVLLAVGEAFLQVCLEVPVQTSTLHIICPSGNHFSFSVIFCMLNVI